MCGGSCGSKYLGWAVILVHILFSEEEESIEDRHLVTAAFQLCFFKMNSTSISDYKQLKNEKEDSHSALKGEGEVRTGCEHCHGESIEGMKLHWPPAFLGLPADIYFQNFKQLREHYEQYPKEIKISRKVFSKL